MPPNKAPLSVGADRDSWLVLDHVPLGACILANDFSVLFWNSVLEDWTGEDRSKVLGRDIRKLCPAFADPACESEVLEVLRGGSPAVFSASTHPDLMTCFRSGGGPQVQHTVVSPLETPGEEGCRALVAVQDLAGVLPHGKLVREIREAAEQGKGERMRIERALEETREELRRLAPDDELTGLMKRDRFLDIARMEEERFKRYKRPFSLLLIRVDRLPELVEAHGPGLEDEIYKNLAFTMIKHLRDVDVRGRIENDTFAVLMPETGLEEARDGAERLRKAVGDMRIFIDSARVTVSASFGIAVCERKGQGADFLLKVADMALGKASGNGGDAVETSPA